jgi:preprotein translocase subunit SecY
LITFLKEVFKKGELRRKVVFTLGMLFVFRLGAAITIPYINADAISQSATSSGIFGIMNMLGGGTLERFSLFSLGVSPYITASIIIELLSMDVIPTLARWQKEGNVGKKKKDKVTRYLTLFLAAIQGGSLTYAFDKGYGILTSSKPWIYVYVVVVMAAGSMFAMWIGDRITIKGVGNGTSLLIFTGIVANLPNQFITTYDTMVSYKTTYTAVTSILWYILFVLAYLAIMIFVVYSEGAVRKIPIFYATNTMTVMHTKEDTHMPIKINSSSVIPVIFAASVLAAPRTIISFMSSTKTTQMIDDILNYQ